MNGSGSTPSGPGAAALSPIKHIIFIMQENHSFDSYFGLYPGLGAYGLPGATAGHPTGIACMHYDSMTKMCTQRVTVPIGVLHDRVPDFAHSWTTAQLDDDNGQMDFFNHALTPPCTAPTYACYVTAPPALVRNYWALANHFVLGDNAFSSVRGPSFANHLYAVAARSGPTFPDSVIDNPTDTMGREPDNWGCQVPTGRVAILDHYNFFTNPSAVTTVRVGPVPPTAPPTATCFYNNMTGSDTIPTLANELNASGQSWKFYTTSLVTSNDYLASFPRVNQPAPAPTAMMPDPSGVMTGATGFDDDASGATIGGIQRHLPSFSWLVAPTSESEHPGASTTCAGENWVSDRINAIERGPDWSSSVIVLAWDDFGGFYDHIVPANVDALGYGFRVPFLIISPFTTSHVTNTVYDFTSVLKLAEDRWGLAALSNRDMAATGIEHDLNTAVTNSPLFLSHMPPASCV